jgi:hypothetical protein
MRRVLLVLAACMGGLPAMAADQPNPSTPLTQEQCNGVWSMPKHRGEAITKDDEAVDYIVDFTIVDLDGNGEISKDEFGRGCAKGMVRANPN